MCLLSKRTKPDCRHAIFVKWISSPDSLPRKQIESNLPADPRLVRNVAFGRLDTQSALNLTVCAIKRKVSFSDVTRRFYGIIQARKRGLLGLITALTQLIDARAPFLRLMAIRQDRFCVFTLTSLLILNCFLPLSRSFANNELLNVNM